MNRNPAFLRTRQRLAGLYAGTMGLILLVFGLGFYRAIAHDQWQSLNRKLVTIAGTLHDGIEPALAEVGQVEPVVEHFLPGVVCVADKSCETAIAGEQRHIVGMVQQENYYVRFIDQTGKLLATVGQVPDYEQNAYSPSSEQPQTRIDTDGIAYREITLFLKTNDQQPWGYIQVGRSLTEYETVLHHLRWQLMLGLPTVMVLVLAASWWLSNLAMAPAYRGYLQIQQFTADAAHELRTPLTVIRSTIDFILGEPQLTEVDSRQTLKIIERQNNRLAHLVQDLLLLSRLDLEPIPLQQPCSLATIATDLIEEFSAMAIAAHLTLLAEIPPNDPFEILGNEEQLYRLLANLIANAIQYTPVGGIITLTLRRQSREILVEVADTGVGIPLADQKYIFDRFYRVHADRAIHTGGTGLGLAIAQAIARAHQGNIHLISRPNQGSTFTLHLPLPRRKTILENHNT
ncbi:HAMP domain-containing histidine kinase (plasmid) [Picosynechococcus sp. PCC 11901]|uniref:two-component system sensor histidine kinase RppB n=1 Tax=Picosynechococcus sp. PCC 11901 TaxID=2579791 RepID=UPI0010FC1036|nr:two-component system sensor histidine kinase RppB [Picosynechococcus sp. PCC 11901]QCS48076.1 HAMP domain-containing histidine kinase [Picosynechococcus sp. PCC 11901]